MRIPKIPKRLGPARQFKQQKRNELKKTKKALEKVRLGCAYTPFVHEIVFASRHIEQAIKDSSVNNWGR